MSDIVPELLKQLKADFSEAVKSNTTLKALSDKAAAGKATYADAYKYAETLGTIQSDVFKANLTSEVMPNGKMYYNIANSVFNETLAELHDEAADFAVDVQNALNSKSGIRLKAIKPEADQSLIDGFVERVSSEDILGDVAWILGEPIKTYALKSVDSTVKRNAEFQHKAGIEVHVIRNAAAHCCQWCSDLDGNYVYPGVPGEVFARHENCRCSLEYDGKKLNNYGHSFRDAD